MPMTAPLPSRAPRVLITRAEDVSGERWDDYADRVRAAGGEPIAIDLADWERGARPAPGEYDALIVTGGVDVDPERYGEPRDSHVTETNPARDAFESDLLRAAIERDIPVLAICRGHQLLNVLYGGSLLQHLAEREPHRSRRGPDGATIASGWHDVMVIPGSPLAAALGSPRVRTNSRHHQAVTPERLAPGLQAVGVVADGESPVIEAMTDPARRWVYGVQWHPERPEQPDGDRLFEALIAAAGAIR